MRGAHPNPNPKPKPKPKPNPNPNPDPKPNPDPSPSPDQVKGGKITIDAGSLSDQFKTENDKRFETSGDVAKLESSPAMATIKADSQS